MFSKKFSKKTFLSLFFIGFFSISLIPLFNTNNYLIQSKDENVISYDQFVNDVNNQLNSGQTEIIIDYDVDLSDFSSSNKINYAGDDAITLDFEGHTIKNKTNEYNGIGPSGSNTLIANSDSGYWDYRPQFLFDSIDKLTLENVTIENSTFIVWGSTSLTLDNVIYKDSYLENIYLKTASSSEAERYLSLFGDSISELTITNSAFYNIGVKQTVWNYSTSGNSSNIGLFTRVGSLNNSLTLENNYFGNIDFSNNQRGVQDNQDGDWNVGLFTNISGSVISTNNYYDQIFFGINNESLQEYKTSALFIFEHGKFWSAQIKDDKISAFINSYKASENEFFYAAEGAYYSGSTNHRGVDIANKTNFSIENTFLINFTNEQANEYIKNNFGTAPLGLVTINDFVSADRFNLITLDEFKSKDFLDSNFNDDFYLLNDDEFPVPILSMTFLLNQSENNWETIDINYELKNGFAFLNTNNRAVINFYEHGKNEIISSYDLEFNNPTTITFKKPNKNKEYYYEVVYQQQSLYVSDSFVKMPMPVWISLLISIIVILIFVLLFFMFLLFLRRKQKEATQLSVESESIALAIYESSNLFGFSLDEALYLLELNQQDLTSKNLASISKNITNNYKKQKISYDEYLKKYEAIIYLKAYLEEVN